MSAVQDKVVVGTLSGVEARNGGWQRFSIAVPGSTYPAKCDTKQPEIIAQAMALMGQLVTVQIREQDSGNPNPHRPGTNYINRYLNTIAAGAVASPTPTQQQPVQQQPDIIAQAMAQFPGSPLAPGGGMQGGYAGQPAQVGRAKEIEIMRQAAAKCAVETISIMPADQQNPAGLVAAAESWMAYFVYGPARFGVTAFDAPAQSTPTHVPQAQPPAQEQLAASTTYNPPHNPPTNPYVQQSDGTMRCGGCGSLQGTPHDTDCAFSGDDDIPF